MTAIKRRKTRTVTVGGVPIGGDNPIVVQSMLKTRPDDVAGALEVTKKLKNLGCRLIRIAVPNNNAIAPLTEFCADSPLPVIADIHFSHRLALAAIEAGVSKIRLNPGNLKDKKQIREVVEACKKRSLPIRVGANSGSIKERSGTDSRTMTDALLDGVSDYCDFIESLGFSDIILSLKASDVETNTFVYREAARRFDYPLHIGLTATGPEAEGKIKSSIALGSLLLDGIGDTIRVSLTSTSEEEVEVTNDILRSVGLLFDRPVIVSCPTCGRCEVDLTAIVEEVKAALIDSTQRISIAVMGCIVNGPGEAAECDAGVACGKDSATLFVRGDEVKKILPSSIVPELLNLVQKLENKA